MNGARTPSEQLTDVRIEVGGRALVGLLRLVPPLIFGTVVVTSIGDLARGAYVGGAVRVASLITALVIGLVIMVIRTAWMAEVVWRVRRRLVVALALVTSLSLLDAPQSSVYMAIGSQLLLIHAVSQVFAPREARWWNAGILAGQVGGLVIGGAAPAAVVLSAGTLVFVSLVAGRRSRQHLALVEEHHRDVRKEEEALRLLVAITALTDLDEGTVAEELVAAVSRLGHDHVCLEIDGLRVGDASVPDDAQRWSLELGTRSGVLCAVPRDPSVFQSAAVTRLVEVATATLRNASRFEQHLDQVRRLTLLDAARNDFVSSVSHELRTPLTVVKGLGVMLATGMVEIDSNEGRQLVGRLDANASRLETMLDSLLRVGQMHRRGIEIALERVDIGRLVTAAADRLSFLADNHDLVVVAPEGLVVRADPALLDHVLENLLANAVKYTPAGTRVELSVEASSAVVTVAVSDEGPGVDPSELPRLTERFFRGGGANTRGTSGLGLGLSLVTEILEAHSSALEVSSIVGQGARFGFVLDNASGVGVGAAVGADPVAGPGPDAECSDAFAGR